MPRADHVAVVLTLLVAGAVAMITGLFTGGAPALLSAVGAAMFVLGLAGAGMQTDRRD